RGYRRFPSKPEPAASPPLPRDSSARRPNSESTGPGEATIAWPAGYPGSRTDRKLDNPPHLPGNLTFHTTLKLSRGGQHMPVKYGVIGCGAIAQRRHIPECLANPDSVLIAIADANQVRCDELGQKYGVKSFCDHKELLAIKEVDAVIVSGPNAMHAPQTIDALSAGKHVLCEKPMATSREEARSMIDAAKKNGKYLMIGLNQRLMPPHVRAKEILQTGRLGKVLSFRTAFKHPGPEGWSVDAAKSWFFRKDQAFMGVTGDLGIHKADLLRWLFNQEFAEVSGMITTRDKRDAEGNLIARDDHAFR